jgi:hypothetical protein
MYLTVADEDDRVDCVNGRMSARPDRERGVKSLLSLMYSKPERAHVRPRARFARRVPRLIDTLPR